MREGFFEASGTLSLAVAVRLLSRGDARRGVLVVGAAPGCAYAIVLAPG